MKQIVIEKDDEHVLVNIKIPAYTKRSNPWADEDEDVGEHPTVIGVFEKDISKFGLAWVIDMDYKDKGDQWTENFLNVSDFMSDAEFEQMCKDCNIPMVYENYGASL